VKKQKFTNSYGEELVVYPDAKDEKEKTEAFSMRIL
jgi:hypothetical protein